ncbi:MAG: SMC-Scp complex subunit ScpB [Clostridiales bacterium]|nr:SMC-Scp complex subunit ScpB [Clostridiales bacterium]
MEIENIKSIIEAILFSAGRVVETKELMAILELTSEDIDSILQNMKAEFESQNRGIEIIKVDNGYQLCSKAEYHQYIYPLFDNRGKPTLSPAALETLSIIAYNPRISRAEIESIRGVNSDGVIYKLLEYSLIEEAGKSDAPGRPTVFRTTKEFLKLFGISSLENLPELPRYKLDENEQIVLEDIMPENTDSEEGKVNNE